MITTSKQKPFFMPIAPTGGRLEYLSEYHSNDQRWDTSKSQSEIIAAYYAEYGVSSLSDRIRNCANRIGASLQASPTGEIRLKVRSVYLCHVRHCMVCQKARTMAWYRRFAIGLPRLFEAYPKTQYLLLTLTIKNCPVDQLRATLALMSHAFGKMMKRAALIKVVLGYVRTMEVTKSKDGEAHPHFHVLLAVKPSYFGNGYITQEGWAELWQESLGVDYRPVVDIRRIRLKQSPKALDPSDCPGAAANQVQDVKSAVRETVKYQVKGSDLVGKQTTADKEWLIKLTDQLDATKQVNMAGIFREFIKDFNIKEREAFEASQEENGMEYTDVDTIFFNWFSTLKRYARRID